MHNLFKTYNSYRVSTDVENSGKSGSMSKNQGLFLKIPNIRNESESFIA